MRTFAIAVSILICGGLAAAQQATTPDHAAKPYHAALPAQGDAVLPPTLDPSQFPGRDSQIVYAMAAKIREVLYQEPCYCICNTMLGHASLLDCFASDHGADCGVCLKEGVYVYQQTKAGKTPAQIRSGLEQGAWQKIDLNALTAPKVY